MKHKKDKKRNTIKDLLKAHKDGLSIQEIMDKTKLARHTVLARLHKLEGEQKVRMRQVNMAKLYYWEKDEENDEKHVKLTKLKEEHIKHNPTKERKKHEKPDVEAVKEEIKQKVKSGDLKKHEAQILEQRAHVKHLSEEELQWTPAMSVGEDKIDEQHQGLLKQINKLQKEISQGKELEVLRSTLSFLKKYIEEHFTYEEAYQKKISYPGLKSHKTVHKKFVQFFDEFSTEFNQEFATKPNFEILKKYADKVHQFMGEWLIKHILGDDHKFYEYAVENKEELKKKGIIIKEVAEKKDSEFDISALKSQIESELKGKKKGKKEKEVEGEFVYTGIEGFDALLEKGIPKGAPILVAGGAGSGKCLDYNEKIPVRVNNKWKIIKIGELVEDQIKKSKPVKIKEGLASLKNKDKIEIITFDQKTLRIKFQKISAFGKKKAPPKLIKIKTDSGRETITTKDHNFITLDNGLIKVTDSKGLSVGNVLPIAGKLPEFKTNNEINLFPFYENEDKTRVWVDRKLQEEMPEIKKYYPLSVTRKKYYLKYRSLPLNDFKQIILPKYGERALRNSLITKISSNNNPVAPFLNLNDDWGNIFGFYLSEGHTPRGFSPVISTGSEEVVQSIEYSGKKVGMNNVHTRKDRTCYNVRPSKMYYPLFTQFGHNAGTKKIPDFIFDVDNTIADQLMKSYFFGDGWIENKARSEKVKQTIMQYACSKSKELLYGLNLLTLRKGNILRFCEKKVKGKTYHSANYCLTAENLQRLDILPDVGKLFRTLRRDCNIYGEANFYRFYENGHRNFTRSSLSKALQKLEKLNPNVKNHKLFNWLNVLTNSDTRWDKITEIEEVDPSTEWVYDLTVNGTHNFMTFSGLFVHNTILCLQTLNYHASQGKKCLYMSFEESDERLIKHMEDFGWNPREHIKKGNLLMKRFNPFEITRSVDALLMKAKGELLIDVQPIIFPQNFKPDVIVVDSLTAIASAFTGKEDSYRIYIEQLFRFFEQIGATSFLITETKQVPTIFSTTGVEEFLADGVVVIYNIKRGNIRERAIEVLKLRGAGHQHKIVAMNITSDGMEIFPEQEVFGGVGD